MKLTTEDIAEFTWLWGQEFFLQTAKGNFIWKSPDYGGDNTIRPYSGSFQNYLDESHLDFGRSKGKHFVGLYCGENVTILDR